MRRIRAALVCGAVVAVLAGCSGDEAPAPTEPSAPGATTPAAEPSPTESAEEERPWCEGVGPGEGDLEVEFGEMGAASDEWSEAMGRQWRHYFPATVRNASDKPCLFQVKLDIDPEGGERMYEQVNMALQPGQAYHFQAFDLESAVDFTGDAEDAEPTAELTPSYDLALGNALVPVYDADLEVEGVSGEGADAVLVADITVNDASYDWEARPVGAEQDKLYLNGLDAEGDVIARAYTVIDAPDIGETVRVEIPVGGGASASRDDDERRNQVPVSTYEDVVDWEIGAMQPDTNYWPKE